MLKFIRGKGQQPSAERVKIQKELYAFRRTAQHGFPHKPSAIAYDAKHKLMAIGTTTGTIKVFGKPGVEFYGQHTTVTGNASDCVVQLLEWIPGTGRILSLTATNHLILWEPAGTLLVPVKSLPFDGKLKKVSSLCCSTLKDIVWIGTEGGNVYQFDLKSFAIKEPVIYHDVVFEQLPQTYKLNPGAIESVKQLPNNPNHLLIAYNRGLTVLWDLEANLVVRSFVSPGHGQSVGLYVNQDGDKFTWYHGDGSYATWDVEDTSPPNNEKYVPYGPDPCKAIDHLVRGYRDNDEIVIFAGGMPRSSYGDHQCVSIHCKDGTKIALDFTSKVIDFFVTFKEDERDEVEALIVLLEEELVAYDLTDPSLPIINSPYLHSLHASAITCNHLVSHVSAEVYAKIHQAGLLQNSDYSSMSWPITGGHLPDDEIPEPTSDYEILLTGHEDGSVKFWDCTNIIMKPLLHVKTAPLFGNNDDADLDLQRNDSSEQLDDSQPPFRKSGQFDPYSDDPRLAVKKISLCPDNGTLVIAGTAGNVIIANFDPQDEDEPSTPIKVVTMNLVSDRDGFVWKGHDQLKVRISLLEDNPPTSEGIKFASVLQVLPPAQITCIAMHSKWNLIAAGTAHGLVLFDFLNNSPVLHKCTLNPNDLTGAGETLSRRKSFKKTLRESFRRLRKGRSTRNNPTSGGPQSNIPAEPRPIERQIEARPVDDGMGSMVRCLTFAQTYITNVHTAIPTLWSGTNSSCVSVFVLNLPQKTNNEVNGESVHKPVTGQLAKEIQIKHRAPVIGISIFDNNGDPLELIEGNGAAPHKVLIASEEQFKVFSLPQLKPVNKYKLTAHEGARVRRMTFATFTCNVPADIHNSSPSKNNKVENTANNAASDAHTEHKHTEIGLLCLTNLGDCLILSIPELKRQLNAAAVRREDINGISSLCFTNYGEALYMMSSSEIQRISLSAKKIVSPEGYVDLEDWPHEGQEEIESENENIRKDNEDDVASNSEDVTTPLPNIANNVSPVAQGLTNGVDGSPNKANETITSSIGDITIDSVRDHLNTTTTTLCSTTTEEVVGRLSVLSTHSNNLISSANSKDITDLNQSNIKDLKSFGDSIETNANSVVVKSVITTVLHGKTNGETETNSTTKMNSFRKESQF